jgi:hypothetical protein
VPAPSPRDRRQDLRRHRLGEHLWFGKSGRFGVEVGGSNRRVANATESQNGLVLQLLLGGSL